VQMAAATPDDVLVFKIGVKDDVGLELVGLEYRVNDGPVREEISLRAAGTREAAKEFRFHLTGRVKEDDVLHLRFKAVDNRRLAAGVAVDVEGRTAPASALEPQITYEPASAAGKDRWFAFKIAKKATPLHETNVLARRAELQKQIDELRKRLTREQNLVQDARLSLREHPSMLPEDAVKLSSARSINRE